ncbi:collagen-like protein [Lutimonas sp.]|uniref:collagen-like protein n=1 Tax=Lutimonas sp. TaxID=1872403 RepID=UPI003D9BE77E
MKKIYALLLFSIVLMSCEGTVGPPGPVGPPGAPGEDGADGFIGQVIEVEADLNADMNFEYFVEIPSDIEVFESDIIVVYRLMEVFEDLDVWEPLPQTIFRDNGILLYTFDYTLFDVRLFLDGTVDFGKLDPNDTDGLIFRIAILPADFAKGINLKNMDDVLKAVNVDSVRRIN